jgi:hypothetical protein
MLTAVGSNALLLRKNASTCTQQSASSADTATPTRTSGQPAPGADHPASGGRRAGAHPPSPGAEQADPGYDWIMETIVVGYDGTEHAERALACGSWNRTSAWAAQLERAGVGT